MKITIEIEVPGDRPAHVPAFTIQPYQPAVLTPGCCTCPNIWMGIFPPPPCPYCAARGVKAAPWPRFHYTVGSLQQSPIGNATVTNESTTTFSL